MAETPSAFPTYTDAQVNMGFDTPMKRLQIKINDKMRNFNVASTSLLRIYFVRCMCIKGYNFVLKNAIKILELPS